MRSNPATRQPYRIGVAVVGALVIAAGLAAIPLPGPGWLVVIAGLAILATEFEWAHRLQEFTKDKLRAWSAWLLRQPMWLRLLIGAATVGLVYGALVLSLHLTGVPGWLPDWAPLWR